MISETRETLPEKTTKAPVVLVHGLGGKRMWMIPLGWRLRRLGYHPVNWTYSSWTGTVERHGDRLRKFLRTAFAQEPLIHIMAHSMGCVVVRAALVNSPIANLGRVVFLAPPNRGSPVAYGVSRVLGSMLHTISDVSTDSTSFVNGLPSWHAPNLGVIAARFDALVPVASTHLEAEADHVVLNATHNSLLFSLKAMQLTANFLETGRFRASN